MKTKILSVLLFFFVVFATAQKQNATFSKQQQGAAMALFVENLKPVYANGKTFSEFEKTLIGNSTNTTEGTALLKKAFQYLEAKTPKETIENQYSGFEIYNAIKFNEKKAQKQSGCDDASLFGETVVDGYALNQKSKTTNCRWFDINCIINASSKQNVKN